MEGLQPSTGRRTSFTKRYSADYDKKRETASRRWSSALHAPVQFQRSCAHPLRAATLLRLPSAQPFFIVGMPRSGTSLAEQILASHPAVLGAGEVRFSGTARPFLVLEREAAGRGPAQLAAGAAEGWRTRTLRSCLRLAAGRALRITDKMPANFLYAAGVIHAAFPQARFIHMQRHPLDTCLSIYFQQLLQRRNSVRERPEESQRTTTLSTGA